MISIVICTREHPAMLERQLRSIAQNATQSTTEAAAAAIWTEAFDYLLPLPDVSIVLAHAGDGRDMTVTSNSIDGDRCVAAMAHLALPIARP